MLGELAVFEAILGAVHEGVCVVNREFQIVFWNHGAEALSGYLRDEMVGLRCTDTPLGLLDRQGGRLCDDFCPMNRQQQMPEQEVFLQHREGHRLLISLCGRPLHDSRGELIGAAEIFRDQSYREALHDRLQQLEALALIDPTTHLPNRRHAEAALTQRLDELSRYQSTFGVLFIDIDNFKQVNDSFGHLVGDRALELTAHTILSSLRPFDFLGRWGGEEFLALIRNVDEPEMLSIAERTRRLVEETTLCLGGSNLRVTISIGAVIASPGDTFRAIVGRADELMYRSKRTGRNRVSSPWPGFSDT